MTAQAPTIAPALPPATATAAGASPTAEVSDAGIGPAPADTALTEFVRRMPSPIGRLEITSDGESITSLAIERGGWLPYDHRDEKTTDVLERAVTQLEEYFAGTRRDFDVPVRLAGTEFQLAVWRELDALPFSGVLSYGEIGLATGRPTAGRAVGGAVGANPVPLLVPCHRVLASNKRITGYSAGEGIPTKIWLLDHEGIEHR